MRASQQLNWDQVLIINKKTLERKDLKLVLEVESNRKIEEILQDQVHTIQIKK